MIPRGGPTFVIAMDQVAFSQLFEVRKHGSLGHLMRFGGDIGIDARHNLFRSSCALSNGLQDILFTLEAV